MYFPFVTCEVKYGAVALDIADRQNAHSMTLAVRAIVELFRRPKLQGGIDREIVAFSISHNRSIVRIFGHYPVIDRKDTQYYRHSIREFSFTDLDGKEKWTAYKSARSVYDDYMPGHLEQISSVVDAIPLGVDVGLSQSGPLVPGTLVQASRQPASSSGMLDDEGASEQSLLVGPQDLMSSTSCPKQPFKKPRTKRAAE